MYGTFFDYQQAHADYFKAHGQAVRFKKGHYIVTPMEESPWVYFLSEGVVNASFAFTSGAERLIGFFLPGMSFAKSGSFFQDSGGDLEYIACSNVTLYRIAASEFFEQLQTNSAFNQEYLTWVLKTQILLIERVVYQGETTIYRKYLRWLLFMAKYYGTGDEQVEIQIPLTHDTVANFLHMTRESINRVTNRVISEGLISVEKKYITIHNQTAIQNLLDSSVI
jgi:CRP-like cAMP-binding protein